MSPLVLLLAFVVLSFAQRVSLEQQATDMLIRARADLLTVCKGRRRHHCHNEKRDELRALQVYYSIECGQMPLRESVLFRFCHQLDHLFEEHGDDDDDDIEKNTYSYDIAEAARRRYGMICANHLNARRCHIELEHELREARKHYHDYCDELIVPKTYDYNGTFAAIDREICKDRVERIFDSHFEIQLGADATYDQTNRRLIVWLAQGEARRICQQQPFHQCAVSVGNTATPASTQAQQWADAKLKFQLMCADVNVYNNLAQLGTNINLFTTNSNPAAQFTKIPAATTTPSAGLAYSGGNIGDAGGNIRNNTYFGFDENSLCIADVNAVFNFNYNDLQDRPHFWFAEHVNDLVADARGVHAFFCGGRTSHDCKEHWEHVEREQRRSGERRNASDLIEDVKHVFWDACESLPSLTGGPLNSYAPASPFLTDDGLYKILSAPPSAFTIGNASLANSRRESACKEAIEHIFNRKDDDDDDRADSFEEIFTNAKFRYNQICADQSATVPTPLDAAACHSAKEHELKRARERGEKDCDYLAHHHPKTYGNGGDEYNGQLPLAAPPGAFLTNDYVRDYYDNAGVGGGINIDDDDSGDDDDNRRRRDDDDDDDDEEHRKRSVLSDDDDDDDFKEGCKRRVHEIFDEQADRVHEEKLSLLTPDEIWRFARYKFNVICGYHDECHDRHELRDWKRRLMKKCEQPQIRSGFIPQIVPGAPALNETTCKHVLHEIFNDHHRHRAPFRKEVLDVARAFYAGICGPSNQVQAPGNVGALYDRVTGLYAANKTTMPDRWHCNADDPHNNTNTVVPAETFRELRRARNHVIHHLCEHLPYEIDRYSCKQSVHGIFDHNLDNQPNNYKQNSAGTQDGGEYNAALNNKGATFTFSPNDAFSSGGNFSSAGVQPPIGQWGFDIPFQEEISNVLRLWIRAQEDTICNSATPVVFVAPGTNSAQGLEFGRANFLQFDCRRRLTLYYGRMWSIGMAKCMKILHDNSRLECIGNVKDMIDTNNDDTPDGGRIYQDFATIKPPQVGAVGNPYWGIYVS